MQLTKQQTYVISKDGSYLSWWKPCGPNCSTKESLALKAGDRVVYLGKTYGGGSDDIDLDTFSKDGQTGHMWPNNWGSCDQSFLSEGGTA